MVNLHPETPDFFGSQAALSPTPKVWIPGFWMVLSAISQALVFNGVCVKKPKCRVLCTEMNGPLMGACAPRFKFEFPAACSAG
jgi:hypothetical protein